MNTKQSEKSVPKTRQLARELEREIVGGVRAAGTLLPSLRELSEERNIGMSSVLGAYRLLEKKGLVVREAGRGTFVAGPERPPVEPGVRIYSWSANNFKDGLTDLFRPQGEVRGFESESYNDYPRFLDWLDRQRLRAPGLVVIDEGLAQVAAAEGLLEPLDALLAGTETERLLGAVSSSCRRAFERNGNCYALPVSCLPTMAYFNRRVFREAGVALPEPGWSWQGLLGLLDPLTRFSGDGRLERGALGLMLDSNGGMPIIGQFGGQLFDAAGNCSVGTEAFAAGVREFMRLYAHPGCCVHKMGDRRDMLGRLLAAGRIGMVIGNELDAAVARRELPPEDFYELRLPGADTGHFSTLSAHGVGILSGSPDAAAQFRELETLYRPEKIERLCAAGEQIPVGSSPSLSPEVVLARRDSRPVCQHSSRHALHSLHELLFDLLWRQMQPSFKELLAIEEEVNRRIRSTR